MAWTSPRTWLSGEVLTATLLNVHLRDNMTGASAGVTNGTNINAAATLAYQRCGVVIVTVSATATGAISGAATLFTLPVGYRPPASIFATVIDTTGDVPIRLDVTSAGAVVIATALASGRILRGQIVIPL